MKMMKMKMMMMNIHDEDDNEMNIHQVINFITKEVLDSLSLERAVY